jgi:hypothetical protein
MARLDRGNGKPQISKAKIQGNCKIQPSNPRPAPINDRFYAESLCRLTGVHLDAQRPLPLEFKQKWKVTLERICPNPAGLNWDRWLK